MPALTRYLMAKYGSRPRAAEWLTVFDFYQRLDVGQVRSTAGRKAGDPHP